MLCQDYTYRYPYPVLITKGRCRVRLYKRFDGGHTILLTELADNPSESVTNACERIATGVQVRWALDLADTHWIGHYSNASFRKKVAVKPLMKSPLLGLRAMQTIRSGAGCH